jgi:hypothetical protein
MNSVFFIHQVFIFSGNHDSQKNMLFLNTYMGLNDEAKKAVRDFILFSK